MKKEDWFFEPHIILKREGEELSLSFDSRASWNINPTFTLVRIPANATTWYLDVQGFRDIEDDPDERDTHGLIKGQIDLVIHQVSGDIQRICLAQPQILWPLSDIKSPSNTVEPTSAAFKAKIRSQVTAALDAAWHDLLLQESQPVVEETPRVMKPKSSLSDRLLKSGGAILGVALAFVAAVFIIGSLGQPQDEKQNQAKSLESLSQTPAPRAAAPKSISPLAEAQANETAAAKQPSPLPSPAASSTAPLTDGVESDPVKARLDMIQKTFEEVGLNANAIRGDIGCSVPTQN